MVQTIKNKNKYKVFFRRVSTINQDLAMQESADAMYRENYIPDEVLIMNEDGVSANKLDIEKRPQMKKLIQMIINDQVDIIYAFDRSRLFRDFYESNYFVSLCKKHKVKIFFTSSGNGQQATDSTLLEGVMNIVSDVEGKNIARRTEEARKRYPPRKLGYIKQKETKQYSMDPAKKDNLFLYFSAIKEVTTHKDLEKALKQFKKILKTTPNQLLKIVNDPFYAGYDLTTGKNKLSHVDPYLSYEEFQKLQAKNAVIISYQEIEQSLKNQDIYDVYCGICRKPMKFHFNVLDQKAWYSCSSKHPKSLIATEDLSPIINKSLEKIIEHLDTEDLLKDSRHFFHLLRKSIEIELKALEIKKHYLMEKIILETDDFSNWRENTHYVDLNKLENEQKEFLNQIEEKKDLLLENESLVGLIKDYLHKSRQANPFFLTSVLIRSLFVYPNEVNIEVSKFDYLQDFQSQYIFNGDDLL
ncbi:recombinase family protein [Neobacillus sp. PS2-9]|uniref:recombinase family protein n=1 Tax=Neobacillus sp. PS2-9 TaxID=3070676 RepID=UPI0027E04717|nr:recombinase family protein [Neobacillus sp. PS2-9]WML57454.1 recombinase family protein [Neobacillus sp. PS2-9]